MVLANILAALIVTATVFILAIDASSIILVMELAAVVMVIA